MKHHSDMKEIMSSSIAFDMDFPFVAHWALKRERSSGSILKDVGRLADVFDAGFTGLPPDSILSIGEGITAGCVPIWGTVRGLFFAMIIYFLVI